MINLLLGFVLVATGDALMHNRVQECARDSGFDYLYRAIAPLVQSADLAFLNMEFPVSPSGRPPRPFVFNAPPEAAGAIKNAGFDIVSIANNHAYDQGEEGVFETVRILDSLGLLYVGTRPVLRRVGNLRVAFLGYTALFNSKPPKNGPIRPLDERSLAEVRVAAAISDVVVVSVHWGVEYRTAPTRYQKEWARRLAEAGADLILGHHPHVLEPLEWIDLGDRRCLVAYSLGNLVSNQSRKYRPDMDPEEGDPRDGVLLFCRVGRDGVDSVWAVPLWTLNNWPNSPPVIRVVPVDTLRALDPNLASLREKRILSVLNKYGVLGQ